MSIQIGYRKVKVDPKDEPKMIYTLMKSGQPFRAISRTEYYISTTQCSILSKKKISYEKL
jgi:hypothetical protein